MRIVEKIDRKKWSEFVSDHPQGNIFQTPEMYDVYKNTKHYEPIFLAVLDKENEILGTLLAVIQKEHSGFWGSLSARSIIFGGPIIKNESKEVLKIILNEYDKVIEKKAIYTQFRNFWDLSVLSQIFSNYGFKFKPWLNYVIDLTVGKNKLFYNLSSSIRRQIRKSVKNNLIVTDDVRLNDINSFYRILSKFYINKVKKPLPNFDFFNSINDLLGKRGLAKYFIIKYNEKLIGGIVCLITPEKCIYEFYVFGHKGFKNIYPSVVATWTAIAWGADNNLKYFDFMGAGSPKHNYGVREFKSKFGGKLVSYGRYEKIHKPFLMLVGKFGLKLWQIFKIIKNHEYSF